MLYVESVKNGRRFLEGARRVGLKKPIVLLKGGRSQAGSRAAASHTGALAHNARVFDAVCRQAGIVQVEQSMDMLDLSAAFSSLPLPKGKRIAIMTLGGGWGVVTADLCSIYGLEIPDLTPEIKTRLDEILPSYWSRSNPVDLVGERDTTLPMKIMEELVRWEGCDAVIHLGILGRKIMVNRLAASVRDADPDYTSEFLDSVNRAASAFEEEYLVHIVNLMEQYKKPIYGVSLVTDQKNQTVFRFKNHIYNGISFPTPERAVKSCSKMLEYQRFIDRHTTSQI
jgi:acyl-CoA synthetase (NDP forming)